MKKVLLLAISFSILVSGLYALDISEGRIMLKIHENSGRYSLYYQEDLRNSNYTPLYFAEDPRTSYTSVLVNNNWLQLGLGDFDQKVEKTVNGAKIIWRNAQIEAVQDFTFINSKGAPLVDGVKISLRITNIGEIPVDIGLRMLTDTYLGEDTGNHFDSSSLSKINSETELRPSVEHSAVISGDKDKLAFMQTFYGKGYTSPEKIVLANWKRLNDSNWEFIAKTSRTFNLLPYSINDSAVAVFYPIVQLTSNESTSYVTSIGEFAPEGFVLDSTSSSSTPIERASALGEVMEDDKTTSVTTDKKRVDEILKKINELLESDDPASAQEIKDLTELLSTLEERTKLY